MKLEGKVGDLYKIIVSYPNEKNIFLFSQSAIDAVKYGGVFDIKTLANVDDIVLRICSTIDEVGIIHPIHGYKWIGKENLQLLRK